jgi:hypothetical protein
MQVVEPQEAAVHEASFAKTPLRNASVFSHHHHLFASAEMVCIQNGIVTIALHQAS